MFVPKTPGWVEIETLPESKNHRVHIVRNCNQSILELTVPKGDRIHPDLTYKGFDGENVWFYLGWPARLFLSIKGGGVLTQETDTFEFMQCIQTGNWLHISSSKGAVYNGETVIDSSMIEQERDISKNSSVYRYGSSSVNPSGADIVARFNDNQCVVLHQTKGFMPDVIWNWVQTKGHNGMSIRGQNYLFPVTKTFDDACMWRQVVLLYDKEGYYEMDAKGQETKVDHRVLYRHGRSYPYQDNPTIKELFIYPQEWHKDYPKQVVDVFVSFLPRDLAKLVSNYLALSQLLSEIN